jgi:hypothetical protein
MTVAKSHNRQWQDSIRNHFRTMKLIHKEYRKRITVAIEYTLHEKMQERKAYP